MVGWHDPLNGRAFEQTPGDREGQESLVCWSPQDLRVGHDLMTEQQRQPPGGLQRVSSCACGWLSSLQEDVGFSSSGDGGGMAG